MTAPIAFFAPDAAPTAETGSDARRMARLTVAALRQAGFDVRLASRFRPGEGLAGTDGDRLRRVASRLAARIVRRIAALDPDARPAAFVSLQIRDGATDLIAPEVARATGIPLVVLRAGAGAVQSETGITLPPFLDTVQHGMVVPEAMRAAFRAMVGGGAGLDPATPWIIASAAVRDAGEIASFRMLAGALARIPDRPWQLAVAGDGPRRMAMAEALFPLGSTRVRLLGTRRGGDIAALYGGADICAWPALREPLALSCLEAQAAGLPVVTCAGTGASAFVGESETGYLVAEGDAAAFADRVAKLLDDAPLRAAMGAAARRLARERHGLDRASAVLREAILGAIAVSGPTGRAGSRPFR